MIYVCFHDGNGLIKGI